MVLCVEHKHLYIYQQTLWITEYNPQHLSLYFVPCSQLLESITFQKYDQVVSLLFTNFIVITYWLHGISSLSFQ